MTKFLVAALAFVTHHGVLPHPHSPCMWYHGRWAARSYPIAVFEYRRTCEKFALQVQR